MLLLNGIRSYGGAPLHLLGQHAHHFTADSMLPANRWAFGTTAAMPRGYYAPAAIVMPMVAGEMSTTNRVTGEGDAGGPVLAVMLIDADLSGTGTMTALGALVATIAAALTGSGGITNAGIQAFLAAVASLTGSGGISAGTLLGRGALAGAVSGSGAAAGPLTGVGAMSADIVAYGTLTPEGLRDAVWGALATAYDQAGTMGEKLNDAGSAGNPWATVIEGTLTAEELLRLIAAALAGEITVSAGTITVKAADDTGTTRITADTDGANRTNLTLTP